MSLFLPNPPDDYRAGQPQWLRVAMWAIRNPLSSVVYKFAVSKVDSPTLNPNGGFIYLTFNGFIPRFISYRGKLIECYIGWRPSGLFGIAFRKAKARSYAKPNFQPPVHD